MPNAEEVVFHPEGVDEDTAEDVYFEDDPSSGSSGHIIIPTTEEARYHSITIGNKNTWTSWHLVPKERPYVAPPDVKTEYVDLAGADGSLDFTGKLNGIRYKNRTGSWTFIAQPGYGNVQTRYSNIMNYLHGKRKRIILSDDPEYVYMARLMVTDWHSEKSWSEVTIKYIADPYKWLIANKQKLYL